jgi:WD40 repeat protein
LHASCRETYNGSWFAVSDGASVYVIAFDDDGLYEPRRLDALEGPVSHLACDPEGPFVAARYDNGEIRLSDLQGASPPTVLQGPPVATGLRFTPDGSLFEAIRKDLTGAAKTWIWSLDGGVPSLVRKMDLGRYTGVGSWILNPVKRQIVSVANPDRKIRVWPLSMPADAAPVILQRGDVGALRVLATTPEGDWLASSGTAGLTLWPLARTYPTVFDRYGERVGHLAFGPEGQWLATSTIDVPGTVRLWQLEGHELPPAKVIGEAQSHAYGIATSPDGQQILLATHRGEVKLLPVDGGTPRTLTDYDIMDATFGTVAFSRDGRLAAGGGRVTIDGAETRVIQAWDLTTFDVVALIDLGATLSKFWIAFTGDHHVLSGSETGLSRWDLETGDSETLFEGGVGRFAISGDDSRTLLVRRSQKSTMAFRGPALVLDLDTGSTTPLTSHGDSVTAVAMDAEGTIAITGDERGVIRVGQISGEEPQLLLGSPGEIWDLAVDPKGRWIASAAGAELRLWPMPDLSKPPLHTLPREELIAKLKTLTNIRVVRDPDSATGWKLTHDPFPGWETVPTW